jgi:hypothetical protein
MAALLFRAGQIEGVIAGELGFGKCGAPKTEGTIARICWSGKYPWDVTMASAGGRAAGFCLEACQFECRTRL